MLRTLLMCPQSGQLSLLFVESLNKSFSFFQRNPFIFILKCEEFTICGLLYSLHFWKTQFRLMLRTLLMCPQSGQLSLLFVKSLNKSFSFFQRNPFIFILKCEEFTICGLLYSLHFWKTQFRLMLRTLLMCPQSGQLSLLFVESLNKSFSFFQRNPFIFILKCEEFTICGLLYSLHFWKTQFRLMLRTLLMCPQSGQLSLLFVESLNKSFSFFQRS
ncbi:unnamed protein product, partial [Larinioides sclopetarius]